jgi:Na+-driven multidrug efflux pump
MVGANSSPQLLLSKVAGAKCGLLGGIAAAVGTVALRYQTAVLPLMAVIVMANMMLQSTGMGLKATITSSARNGIFFIPLILILPPIFGLFGVEITQSVADIFSFALALPLAMSEIRKM